MPSTPTHSLLRPHGQIIVTDPALAHETHVDTLRCVHCSAVMVYRKGSGGKLGHCGRCMGPTCGTEKCSGAKSCVHWEKKLDLYEAGKLASL